MRCVISTYHVYASVSECTAQGLAVSGGLYGGIAFYQCAFVVIIGIGKPEVGGAGLSCELFALQGAAVK